MSTLLVILALVVQLTDLSLTCDGLRNGGKEVNPLLPNSCAGIAAVKSAFLAPMFFLDGKQQKIYAGVMIGSGAVGITLTLVFKRKV